MPNNPVALLYYSLLIVFSINSEPSAFTMVLSLMTELIVLYFFFVFFSVRTPDTLNRAIGIFTGLLALVGVQSFIMYFLSDLLEENPAEILRTAFLPILAGLILTHGWNAYRHFRKKESVQILEQKMLVQCL